MVRCRELDGTREQKKLLRGRKRWPVGTSVSSERKHSSGLASSRSLAQSSCVSLPCQPDSTSSLIRSATDNPVRKITLFARDLVGYLTISPSLQVVTALRNQQVYSPAPHRMCKRTKTVFRGYLYHHGFVGGRFTSMKTRSVM